MNLPLVLLHGKDAHPHANLQDPPRVVRNSRRQEQEQEQQ